ncbi:heparan-alpha-glucosaminide N-acetyltransferase [Thermococcus sp. 2319x1]|uniref:heparan-alpha-glucosaminide N-acetyltransferase n=1 Tax=Thermococcus sp. 2319x1 TaxID=1674923 RepID=UPI0015817179|nr:heparan-alpha-glucosaminide N-acetyltransferase [Thermococcus sp. 2319x1]
MFGSEVYSKRFWEVDFVRGIALIMMLISNFVTDLQFFLGYSEHKLFWRLFAYATASLFVSISGLSLWISHARGRKSPKKYLLRFTKLFGLGLLITLITSMLLDKGTIYFGVLHFLGVASLLIIPLYSLGWKNIFPAVLFLLGGQIVKNVHADTLLFLPLGITPREFFTLDYFPIFPWFGVFLLGTSTGALIYPEGKRKFKTSLPKIPPVEFICFMGRNTLGIYLIHQPVFVGFLMLLYGGLPNLGV